MDSQLLRLVAHLLTIALLLAIIAMLLVARGKPVDWHYWRLLTVVLSIYALWFVGLASSSYQSALVSRAALAWALGILEFSGACGGWAWWALTVRRSFAIEYRPRRDVWRGAGD